MNDEHTIADHLETIAQAMVGGEQERDRDLVEILHSIDHHLTVIAACAAGYLFHIHGIEIKKPEED